MSQSNIAPRRSSPCCIGCIVLLIIVIGFSAAIGIYMYRFAKNNISIVQVAEKSDPALDTAPETLLPATVGDFKRTSLSDSMAAVPEMADLETSGVQVAVYEDDKNNKMTVIAMSSEEAQRARQTGLGPLIMGRGKANSSDTGYSINIPYTDKGTITTWTKPNWTFMVQTTSTLTKEFVRDFMPGGGGAGNNAGTTATISADGLTTQ